MLESEELPTLLSTLLAFASTRVTNSQNLPAGSVKLIKRTRHFEGLVLRIVQNGTF